MISYLQGIEDFKEMVKENFLDLNFGILESEGEEEVGEIRGKDIRIEDFCSPAREDQAAEDAASASPPAIIVLSNHAEVDKSLAPNGA